MTTATPRFIRSPRKPFSVPAMPECWDDSETWRLWCLDMWLTYKCDNFRCTREEALLRYCVDCDDEHRAEMVLEGRCRKGMA